MTLDEFAQLCGKPRKTADGYDVLCPRHDDDRQSLSIAMGDRGIILHCHAGCPSIEILSVLGLSFKDISGPGEKPATSELSVETVRRWHQDLLCDKEALAHVTEDLHFPRTAIAKWQLGLYTKGVLLGTQSEKYLVYPYRVGAGFAYAKLRSISGAKRFWRIPSGAVSRLYNGYSIQPGGKCILVEGERDAVACDVLGIPDRLGAVVVSLPDGANPKSAAVSVAPLRQQKRVWVCTDADDSGDKAATAIAKALGDCAVRYRLPHHKDFGDVLASDQYEHDIAADMLALEPVNKIQNPGSGMELAYERYLRQQTKGEAIISTGFPELDRFVHGLLVGEPHLYAGRPGAGKSALSTGVTYKLGCANIPVAIFWLEDPDFTFWGRMAAYETRELKTGELIHGSRMTPRSMELYKKAIGRLSNCPIYLSAEKGRTIESITEEMQQLKEEHGIKVFILDHFSRIRLKGTSRPDLEIGQAAYAFAECAERLDASAVMFYQLSRLAEDPSVDRSGLRLISNSDIPAQAARVVGYLSHTNEEFHIDLPKVTSGVTTAKNEKVRLGWDGARRRIFSFDRKGEVGF